VCLLYGVILSSSFGGFLKDLALVLARLHGDFATVWHYILLGLYICKSAEFLYFVGTSFCDCIKTGFSCWALLLQFSGSHVN